MALALKSIGCSEEDLRDFVTQRHARQAIRQAISDYPALAPLSEAEWEDYAKVPERTRRLTSRMESMLQAAVALVGSHPGMQTNRARGLLFSTLCCSDKNAHPCWDNGVQVLLIPHKNNDGLTDISFLWEDGFVGGAFRPTTNLSPFLLLRVAEICKRYDSDGTAEYTCGVYRIHLDLARMLDSLFMLAHPPTQIQWRDASAQSLRHLYNECANKISAYLYADLHADVIAAEPQQPVDKIKCFFNTL